MSACNLSIRFDQPDRHYKLGEKVHGTIEVQVESDCHCKALKAACFYKAYGYSHWTEGQRNEKVLFSGDWKAGHTYLYSFDFEISKGPLTFHGEHFNIHWFIEAKAALESVRDSTAQAIFSVVSGGPVSCLELPNAARPEQAHRFTMVKIVAMLIGFLVIGVPGLIVLILGIRGLLAGQNAAWMGVIGGSAFALVGSSLGFRGVRSFLGTRALKIMSASVEPCPCRAGEEVRLNLIFLPRKSFAITRVMATLMGKESLIRRGADYEREIHRDEQQLLGSMNAGSSQPITVSGCFNVPHQSPHSFRLTDTLNLWEIAWTIRVVIELEGRPDWIQAYDVIVSP